MADPTFKTDSSDASGWYNNILNSFESFGYTPTEQEIDALMPAAEGVGGYQVGQTAVANYVLAHQELKGAQSEIQGNLLSEQNAQSVYENLSQTLETQGQDAYNKAADIFTQAPQLFGSMTPDQIDQYLSPLKSQFDYSTGATESAMGARGLSGSSLDANAQALAANQFRQSVLSQGLGIGMQQQQNRAGVLQNLGSGQFNLASTYGGLGAQYGSLANQSAGQNATLAGDISGLAGQAANQAIAQNAAIQALNPQKQSFLGGLSSGFENIAQQDILNLGQNLIGSVPGLGPMTQPRGGGGSNPVQMIQQLLASGRTPTGAPSNGLGSMGAAGSTLLPPSLSLTGGLVP